MWRLNEINWIQQCLQKGIYYVWVWFISRMQYHLLLEKSKNEIHYVKGLGRKTILTSQLTDTNSWMEFNTPKWFTKQKQENKTSAHKGEKSASLTW